MIKYLYAKVIPVSTIPKAGEQYAFRFTWRATEDLTWRNVADAFAIIEAHLEAKYLARVVRILGAYPEEELGPEITFILLVPTKLTLREIWDETKAFALDHYLDFTFEEAVIYRPKFPWWLLAIAAVEAGGIVYVVKKKKA